MTRDDSEPAFPRPDSVWTNPNTGGQSGTPGHPEMSLLEYYVGAALISMGTWCPDGPTADLNHSGIIENRAIWAIEQAEAVVAQLEKRKAEEKGVLYTVDDIRKSIFSLCTDTLENAGVPNPENEHGVGFLRGRQYEAKSIARAIGEMYPKERNLK